LYKTPTGAKAEKGIFRVVERLRAIVIERTRVSWIINRREKESLELSVSSTRARERGENVAAARP